MEFCNFPPSAASKKSIQTYFFGEISMNLLSSLFGPPVPSLNAVELSEKLKNSINVLVVDVRQPEEYVDGHIAGSKLIPLGELSNRVNELLKNSDYSGI